MADLNLLLDKKWRMSHLYRVQNKNNDIVVYNHNSAQEHFEKNRAQRNIICKSRQLGITTYEAIDALDDTLFNLNFNSLFIAHQKDEAIKIFDNKIGFALANLDSTIKEKCWRIETDRANLVKFEFVTKDTTRPTSSIAVALSGRSGTFSRIHVSEFAKLCRTYPRKAEEIITGTFPAVPIGGRIDIESTADGDYGPFYEIFWEAWKRGEPKNPTDFKAHFYNWTWDKAEIAKVVPCSDLPSEFLDIQERYDFSDKEISYYYYQFISLNRKWDRLHAEYPITPEEAFVSSGNKLFAAETIDSLEPKEGVTNGDWIYYNDYSPTHRYGLGADVAEGIGGDSSAIVIWDFTIMDVAAIYASNKIEPDTFAYEIRDGGLRYGTCMVAPERNNHGHATLAKLKEIYPIERIYSEKRTDNKRDVQTDRLGWATTKASKPKLIYDLKQALDEGILNVCSRELVWELRTYGKEDINEIKTDPDRTNHWDLLMAACIGWQLNKETEYRTMKQRTVGGGVQPFYPELGI